MNKRKKISCIYKWIVIIAAITGVYLSVFNTRAENMGGSAALMYFTMQSNIALAIVCFGGFIMYLRSKEVSRFLQLVKFVATLAITLTGLVFCLILAPVIGRDAWHLHTVLTHVIVPLFSVIDFFTVAVEYKYQEKDLIWIPLPELLYVIYAAIGYIRGWEFLPDTNYPYYFLNWGSPAGAFGFSSEIPFMGCFWWILLLVFILEGTGFLYLKIVLGLKLADELKRR